MTREEELVRELVEMSRRLRAILTELPLSEGDDFDSQVRCNVIRSTLGDIYDQADHYLKHGEIERSCQPKRPPVRLRTIAGGKP